MTDERSQELNQIVETIYQIQKLLRKRSDHCKSFLCLIILLLVLCEFFIREISKCSGLTTLYVQCLECPILSIGC